jgi:hypothetical protein
MSATQNPPIEWAPERRSDGTFAPGSGGRPRNAKNKLSRDALAAVQALSGIAIMKLRERIEASDMTAIRLCIELTVPRGGRTIETDSTDPMAWADLMASGDISPTECATAAQALVKLNEAGEIADLSKRLQELEASIGERR